MSPKYFLVVVISLLLVCQPAIGATPVVGQVNVKGEAKVNGTDTPSGATIFAGDRLATEPNSVAELHLVGGSNVMLPSSSAVVLQQSADGVVVSLKQGALAVLSNNGAPAVIEANGARIRPVANAPSVIEVAIRGNSLNVLARRGAATVETAGKTVNVSEASELRATMAVPASSPASPSPSPAGLSTLATWGIIAGAAGGLTGLGLGIAAVTGSSPQDCTAVSASGSITCP